MNICFEKYDRFSNSIRFWSSERNTENTMSGLYFNEESDYSEQNTCDNKVFCSTPFFNHFSLSDPEQKRKKLNIFTLQLPIYY